MSAEIRARPWPTSEGIAFDTRNETESSYLRQENQKKYIEKLTECLPESIFETNIDLSLEALKLSPYVKKYREEEQHQQQNCHQQ